MKVAKYLKTQQQAYEWVLKERQGNVLNDVFTIEQLERRIPSIGKANFKNKYHKGGFSIQRPDLVERLLDIIMSEYKYQSSSQEHFEDKLKKYKKINAPTALRRYLAK